MFSMLLSTLSWQFEALPVLGACLMVQSCGEAHVSWLT